MFEVKIIEDSASPQGIRLVTYQLKYPRYIHAELLTHRVFSRNASSSRAIPVNKLAQISLDEMVEPIRWGLNQPGMQAQEQDLTGEALEEAKKVWKETAEVCAKAAVRLNELGLHKQWSNRPLEWFGNINVIVTSTHWDNWDELRMHPTAMPDIHHLANLMFSARQQNVPKQLLEGQWHLPYIREEERPGLELEMAKQVSAARCCRVSYLNHDGKKTSMEEDLALCEKLVGARPLHASPFEHQATPDREILLGDEVCVWRNPELHGNFEGWIQYRKTIEDKFN